MPAKSIPVSDSVPRGENSSGEDILFVLYNITKNNNSFDAKMNSAIIKPGKLKEDMRSTASANDDDIFIVETLGPQKNIIKSFYLSNPLNEIVEYVADDNGTLASKLIQHESKELVARMNVDDNTSSVKLYQRKTNKDKKSLLHTITID